MAETAYPRLLLRLISRSEAETVLEVAMDIGRTLGADLAVLFVEEEDALAACALPFATVLDPRGTVLDVDRSSLETLVMREAAACERLVRRMAERARLRWSFHAGRGRMANVLASARCEEDIVVVHVDRFSFRWRGLRDFAAETAPRRGGVLIVPNIPARDRGHVIVAVTGDGQTSTPDLASRIAQAENRNLVQITAAEIARGHAPAEIHLVITRIDALTEDVARTLRAIRAPILVLH